MSQRANIIIPCKILSIKILFCLYLKANTSLAFGLNMSLSNEQIIVIPTRTTKSLNTLEFLPVCIVVFMNLNMYKRFLGIQDKKTKQEEINKYCIIQ